MQNSIGRIVLLVHDYDEALAFYEKALGFQLLFDVTSETGQRYLHVAPSGKNSAGIWFLKAHSEEQQKVVGKQTQGQPTFVLYTNSFDQMHERLLQHKVRIKKEPEEAMDSRYLHFLDLYGNEIVLVQLKQP